MADNLKVSTLVDFLNDVDYVQSVNSVYIWEGNQYVLKIIGYKNLSSTTLSRKYFEASSSDKLKIQSIHKEILKSVKYTPDCLVVFTE